MDLRPLYGPSYISYRQKNKDYNDNFNIVTSSHYKSLTSTPPTNQYGQIRFGDDNLPSVDEYHIQSVDRVHHFYL